MIPLNRALGIPSQQRRSKITFIKTKTQEIQDLNFCSYNRFICMCMFKNNNNIHICICVRIIHVYSIIHTCSKVPVEYDDKK